MSNDVSTFNDVLVGCVTLERDYDKRGKGFAGALYALAQACTSAADFGTQCDEAEAWIRSEDAGTVKLEVGENLPRAWKQARSDIAGGMNRGLNPNEHESYSKFKQAKADSGKAGKEADNLDKKDKDGPRSIEELDADTPMGAILQDLVPTASCLVGLPELTYKRVLGQILNMAEQARKNHMKNETKGGQHKTAEQKTATS